jgi:hypothetical protein
VGWSSWCGWRWGFLCSLIFFRRAYSCACRIWVMVIWVLWIWSGLIYMDGWMAGTDG